jgi:hypothetical protein
LGGAWALPSEAQAVSQDGLLRLSAEPFNHTLLLQDALGMQVGRYPWPALATGLAAADLWTPVLIKDHPLRRSFVVAFGGSLELWEIFYDRHAEPIYDGLVHDYRLGEGLAKPGYLGVRRTRLEQPLDDFWIDVASPHVLGRARWAQGEVQVINLDIRRSRDSIPVPPAYRLSQAVPVVTPAGRVLKLPSPEGEPVQPVCLLMDTWRLTPCPP